MMKGSSNCSPGTHGSAKEMGNLWGDSLARHEAEPQTVGGAECAQGLTKTGLGDSWGQGPDIQPMA